MTENKILKDCKYYEEQIMLKYYNEDYDNSLDIHLQTCFQCNKFNTDLTKSLSLNSCDDYNSKFDEIFEKIIIPSKSQKKFNFNFLYYAASITILITVLSATYFYFNNQKLKQNIAFNSKINFADSYTVASAVEKKYIAKGGETNFSVTDLEAELIEIENKINLIFTEGYYNEEI